MGGVRTKATTFISCQPLNMCWIVARGVVLIGVQLPARRAQWGLGRGPVILTPAGVARFTIGGLVLSPSFEVLSISLNLPFPFQYPIPSPKIYRL